MPSIQYINQSAPFWDFIANLESQGNNHPFFNQNRETAAREGESSDEENPWSQAWGWGAWQPPRHRGGWGHRGMPHHGPPHHGPGPHHHRGPPPPPPHEGEHPPPPPGHEGEKPAPPPGDGPNYDDPPHSVPPHDPFHGRHGPFGGPHGHGGPRRHGGCGRRGRGFGRVGWMGGPMGAFGFAPLAEALQSQLFGDGEGEKKDEEKETADFKPEADVFDTESAFVVHVSVPGAKKEDVGVNWDVEKSELTVAGVTYRPGDEDFIKTLAMDERKVGPFEKKIRLGTRANPAQVDADAITAKLEDGVLRIEVPKMDRDYVEVKKVDIE